MLLRRADSMAIAEEIAFAGRNPLQEEEGFEGRFPSSSLPQETKAITLHSLHDHTLRSDEASIDDASIETFNISLLHHSLPSDEASMVPNLHLRSSPLDEASMAPTLHDHNSPFEGSMAPMNSALTLQRHIVPSNEDSMTLFASSEPLPLSAEYFGLAIALCALGLLRNTFLKNLSVNSGFSMAATLSRAVQDAISGSELLGQKSTAAETRAEQETEAAERFGYLQQIQDLQEELLDLRRQRAQDGKANERVVSIFASREQTWKAEKRKLRNEQRKLWQELQRSFVLQEGLRQKFERLRSVQQQACSECEQREGLLVELKERLSEQEFLIMATMEEAQAEQQEKNALAGKLASVESSLSQLQEKLSMDAEAHSLELTKHEETIEQLETRFRGVEMENSQALQDLKSTQTSLAALIHEKNRYEELFTQMSSEITQLHKSAQEKEDVISAMLKKANADTEDRHELEKELAIIKVKHGHAEREKETWRWLVEESWSCSRTEIFKPRNGFGGSTSDSGGFDMIRELQKLHDVEIGSLQSAFEEQVKLLQKRLSLYQERVADLEEDILVHMGDSKRMISFEEHDSFNLGELMDKRGMIVLKESMEAELATKQFQLSVAKTLLKQYMDSEAHREQEIEKWKKLYLASKATIGMLHKKEHSGITPKNPRLQDWLELEKARYASKLEQRHWQEIEAFERQMKARDERMEAFRWQLLNMEDEAQRRVHEIETLNKSLAAANDDKMRLEELLKQKEEELKANKDKVLVSYTQCASVEGHEREIQSLQEKVSTLQNLLTEKELEYELTLTKMSVEAESELQDRDCKLAVAEAQLVQAHIICDRERKEKEKLLMEFLKEKSALEHFLENCIRDEAEQGLQDVAYEACLALQRLSTRISEAQTQVLQREKIDEEHLKELVEKSVQYSNCGSKVTTLNIPCCEEEGRCGKKDILGESVEPLADINDGSTVDKFISVVQPNGLV